MKKYQLTGLVLLFTALLLSGCGSGRGGEAFSHYQNMNQAMAAISSAEWEVDAVYGFVLGSTKMDLSMGGTVQEELIKGIPEKIKLDFDLSLAGSTLDMKAYYQDGWYYLESDGNKTKRNMDVEEMLGKANIQILQFPASSILNSQVKSVSGGQELFFKLKGDALTKMSKQILTSLGSLLAGLSSNESVKFGDAECKMVVGDDNILKSYELSFDLTLSVSEQETVIKCSSQLNLKSLNDVTIVPPGDLDSYVINQ
ncbi:MAG: hypothetical protein LBB91_07610 [Clostridiales bacterium]|jgi:hypothetical protein|nr:hypothetical protein [Clostridiales bacterium]